MKKGLMLLGIGVLFFACGSPNQNNKNGQKGNTDTTVNSQEEGVKTPKINADSLVKAINIAREKVDQNLKSFQKKSLPTTNLRAQIKQKWFKIEYYSENAQIVKVMISL